MTTAAALPDFQVQLLTDGLRELFGEVDDEILSAITPMLEWIEVSGGEVVVREGGTDTDLYFIISGRLRAYRDEDSQQRQPRVEAGDVQQQQSPSADVNAEAHQQQPRGHAVEGPQRRFLSEMKRGETIGEVAFFTGAARTATVIAIRDSVLVRITRPNLEKLLAAFPWVTLNMARLVIARLNRANSQRRVKASPVNICLWPITAGVAVEALAARLVARFPAHVEAILMTSAGIGARLGIPDIASVDKSQGERYRQLSKALDELESRYAMVICVPDADLESAWSQRCLRIADRIVLLADAKAPPAISPAESRHLLDDNRVTDAEQVLVLLHGQNEPMPSQTADWLNRRPLAGHLHIRPELDRDLARLARTLSGHAIGLVFSGGGARCFAHLGVYKALQESGIEIDCVGGTSTGAVMGALAALDKPADEVIAYAREIFHANPTGDISLLPLISLIKGRHLKGILEETAANMVGADARIEDTWKTFFCVASNYSKPAEVVLKQGKLARSLRASCAIPGLFPPVPVEGDLLVDGGAFNNFPVDVMAHSGVARIIGVGISRDLSRGFKQDEIPGNWALMGDKLTGSRRQYRVPSLMQILMNTTTLYSASREAAGDVTIDLPIKLNLHSMDLLDWHKFDYAVGVGYRRARKVLAAMTTQQLAPYRM